MLSCSLSILWYKIMNGSLRKIKIYYLKYILNSKYVYKSCHDCIVILEKIDITETNEKRILVAKKNKLDEILTTVVIKNDRATFRGNNFRVVKIFDKMNPRIVHNKIENSFYSRSKIIYELGKIVCVNSFNEDLNSFGGDGIYYYKSIVPAFYFELIKFNPKYTGKIYYWDDNGYLYFEGNYLEGMKHGEFKVFKVNQRLLISHNYKLNVRVGQWINYFHNENIKSIRNYEDGVLHGLFLEYHCVGTIHKMFNYNKGKINGKYIENYLDGTKHNEINFVNGIKHGESVSWYSNSNIKTKCTYINGLLYGIYECWYENGNICLKKEFMNGMLNGKEAHWYQSGMLKYIHYFTCNKEYKTWTGWYHNGTTKYIIEHNIKDDNKKTITFWTENAKLIKTSSYKVELSKNMLDQI